MSRPSLTFLGGVGTVTGSKFLVDTGQSRVLLDCGLFQGLSDLRRRNWAPLPVDWRSIDAVVLTHAHLDHTGYLPVLARDGWSGDVYATEATARLAEIVLRDSAHLQEEDARWANEAGFSKHRPARPLYDQDDAARATKLLRPLELGVEVAIAGDVRLRLGHAGHILGSSWALLTAGSGRASRRLVTSGDLGRNDHPLLTPPEPRPLSNALLLESTYGDRRRSDSDVEALERLAGTIRRTIERGGSVLVPAFAVDRTEVLLHALAELLAAGRIPHVPIVLDSPMALACLATYREAIADHAAGVRPGLSAAALHPPGLVEARTAEESMRWNSPAHPAIIVSASGMASGGRVLHHLRHQLPERRNTVAIIGFAAEGTRARQLLEGAAQVKIHGEYVPVRAEIASFDAFSAHADRDELVHWATATSAPDCCYVVHGEPHASATLAAALGHRGWTAVVPRPAERVLV
ncbi:MAG: MBL fold metallo-hydrolase RNA specificity domain-containing protein [Jatrophihabitans sp.]|uniref:MBL fold metallo-hydrolase RNA specificity domain-containing protein n=1 Tax=Jatrophihabitans sp. TaxID=1932789 RepID=UPI003F7F2059